MPYSFTNLERMEDWGQCTHKVVIDKVHDRESTNHTLTLKTIIHCVKMYTVHCTENFVWEQVCCTRFKTQMWLFTFWRALHILSLKHWCRAANLSRLNLLRQKTAITVIPVHFRHFNQWAMSVIKWRTKIPEREDGRIISWTWNTTICSQWTC